MFKGKLLIQIFRILHVGSFSQSSVSSVKVERHVPLDQVSCSKMASSKSLPQFNRDQFLS